MMDERTFLEAFSEITSIGDSRIRSFRDEWGGEEPPWTVLFGALGAVIAEEWSDIGDRSELFGLIETAIPEGTEPLALAVTTGMLEALVSAIDAGVIAEADLGALLGPESRAYVAAWRKFTTGGA